MPLAPVRQAWESSPQGPLLTVLTPAEVAVSAMHHRLERRLAHLAGRIAAKSAVLHHLRARGYPLEPQELGLTQWMAGPEQGRPVAQLPAGVPPCELSITHSQGLAVAAVTERGRLGVDLERVNPRPAAFLDEAFTRAEQDWLLRCELLQGRTLEERWNLGWCLKEALVKCSGQGLRASLQQTPFSGWTEQGAAEAPLPGLTEGAGALAQLITLHTPGAGSLTGLLALGQGYAFAALHESRERLESTA
ncbi:4'-phosphopantetheinyl transferase family protein [Stigmatella erecta]|uniref:4'-phosphopantetheinyl transferase n=1 Tax=Stigmatella erecta TaxID=83460 RepID=A0A1I0KX11_9BACT|nr:4'-phosphopantetheinyl transferase superfamily protein [Stigmatella erecta]SEU30522.1 4'-phosphopantetheinyl transferase [Stigmatella erecta]